jgi:hypothetical protein
MRITSLILLAAISLCGSAVGRPDHPAEHQIVTVRVTSQTWNEYRPWQKTKPSTRTYAGIVLEGNRILMITGRLADATLIQVEKFDRPPRFPARIVHVDYQAGLAILTVDEPGFFDDLHPADIADNATGQDYYSASWKSGQLTLSACRWSQATVFKSSMPHFNYPGIYFITDLKGGGWGEPVFSGDKLIGISNYQRDNRTKVIPAELIRAYLQAIEQPNYPGFAWLGIHYQVNKGLAQAAYFGQQGRPSGVVVLTCYPGGSAEGFLLTHDILLELDGHPIDSLGDYVHPLYGPVDVSLIPSEGHYAGDTITARVLRNGEEVSVEIPLKNTPPSAALIPEARLNTPPPYLLAGGLVFRELDEPYLQAWGDDWESKIPSYLRTLLSLRGKFSTPEQTRLIVLTDVFPDKYNLGYHDMSQYIVERVNGISVDSIQKMEEAFQQPIEGYHIIEFMPSYGIRKVILDAATLDEATAAIMEKYQIPSRMRTRP